MTRTILLALLLLASLTAVAHAWIAQVPAAAVAACAGGPVISCLSPGGVQPNSAGSNTAVTSYLSPGAVQQ